MDIVLTTPPWDGRGVPPHLHPVKEVPPVGLVSLAGHLLEAGHHVRLVDPWQRGLPLPEAVAAIDSRADVIGIGGTTRQAPAMYDLAKALREMNPETLLVAGGPHVTARPQEGVDHGFHIVVRGEGEMALASLPDLMSGRETPVVIPAVGAPLVTPAENLPMPAWHLVEPSLYASVAPVMSARGCPRRCYFCAVGGRPGSVRERSLTDVAREIDTARALFGATLVEFLDDTLLSFPARLDALSEQASARNCSWSAQGTIRDVLRLGDRLARLAAAGLTGVFLGVESGSDAVLKHVGKGLHSQDISVAVRCLFDNGVGDVVASFILGHPWETEESLDQTVAIVLELAGLGARIQVSHLIPFPGTAVGDHPELLGVHLIETDWSLYDGTRPLVAVPGITPERVHDRYLELLDHLSRPGTLGKDDCHATQGSSRPGQH